MTTENKQVDKYGINTKLSGAIRQVTGEIKKLKVSEKYALDMGNWHNPIKGICHVCLGGAIMAGPLKTPNCEYRVPENFVVEIQHKLTALDFVRKGEIRKAVLFFGQKNPDIKEYNKFTSEHATPFYWGVGAMTDYRISLLIDYLGKVASGLETFNL